MNGNEELPSKSIYSQIEKDGNLPNAELNHILALLHNEVKPDVVKSRMSVKSANKQTGKWKVIKTSGAPPPPILVMFGAPAQDFLVILKRTLQNNNTTLEALFSGDNITVCDAIHSNSNFFKKNIFDPPISH